jgi:hypothetical protein
MGKDPAALVVWKEGVSKYPTEGRIWDALAIYQAGRGRAMEAALASRASLKAFGDRGTVMNEIYKLSRERLSVEELATLREREQGLDEELRRWKAAADEARRAATPYLTPECARFIRDYEGAQKEWVASSSSSASAAEASPASGRVRVFVKPVDPWVYQKAGMWFRFKTTVGRTEHYEDLGLKAKDSTSNTFTSQRFREGQAEPVQETHAKHPQYRIYGEEKVQVGDRSFACEVRSWIAEPGAPETEDREWVVPGGRYAGAVLKATAPRRTLVAKKVWDHALKIQGREFDCVVVESESRSDGAVTSVKTWYSANLPTALRMETDEIAVTLVDYGFAWSDRPAFPGAQKK